MHIVTVLQAVGKIMHWKFCQLDIPEVINSYNPYYEWLNSDDQSCVVAISFEEKGENCAFSLRPHVDVVNT